MEPSKRKLSSSSNESGSIAVDSFPLRGPLSSASPPRSHHVRKKRFVRRPSPIPIILPTNSDAYALNKFETSPMSSASLPPSSISSPVSVEMQLDDDNDLSDSSEESNRESNSFKHIQNKINSFADVMPDRKFLQKGKHKQLNKLATIIEREKRPVESEIEHERSTTALIKQIDDFSNNSNLYDGSPKSSLVTQTQDINMDRVDDFSVDDLFKLKINQDYRSSKLHNHLNADSTASSPTDSNFSFISALHNSPRLSHIRSASPPPMSILGKRKSSVTSIDSSKRPFLSVATSSSSSSRHASPITTPTATSFAGNQVKQTFLNLLSERILKSGF
ncbi:hypothetical protein BKA69DRAFT_1047319, partial [Paraphysoderma sedebokerense]